MFQAILSTIGQFPVKRHLADDIVVAEPTETRLKRSEIEDMFQQDLQALTRRSLTPKRPVHGTRRDLAHAC